ncbi:tape measure protein [Veillonella criceti]|uniref:DNA methylase n=1 Tax=Veillonella criceti TaxID=103891 RepID=A0A380NJ59_9FIRM|nr:tape measure protein [Veillonella criceti]SUP42240.1 DNA methylase [Veillonella criceti]
MAKHEINVKITADANNINNELSRLQKGLDKLDSKVSKPRVDADVKEANTKIKHLESEIKNLKSNNITMTLEAGKANSEIDQLKANIKALKSIKLNDTVKPIATEAKNATYEVSGLKSVLSSVRNAVVSAFAVSAITGFAKEALQASANLEILKKGLAFNLGSAGAEQLINDIKAIGEASAYDTNELMPMARAWVNIGDSAQSAAAKMQTIVDAGSAWGLTSEQIGRVNTALTQMQMKGKISAEEMMQLTEAGLPAWDLLSQKMGVSVADLQDMARGGDLTREAMSTLFDAMKEKTEGAAASLSDSLMGRFSNLQETITNSMAGVGDIISKAFDVPGILAEFSDLAEKAKGHIENIKANATNANIGDAILNEISLVSPAAGSMANTVVAVFVEIKQFVEENKTAVKDLIAVIASIATTVTVINAVKNGFIAAKMAALAFKAAVVANPILLAVSLIVAALVMLYMHWDEVKEVAIRCWDSINSWIDNTSKNIRNAVGGAIDWVSDKFNSLKQALAHPIDFIINKIESNSASTSAVKRKNGGIVGFASGGRVNGHGTGRSDSIPAMLSNGEYVINAKAVNTIGIPALNAINSGQVPTFSAGGFSEITHAFNVAKAGKEDKVQKIIFEIKSKANTSEISAYAKVLEKAKQQAEDVGNELAKYQSYAKKATEEAEKYAKTGEKTIAMKEKLTSIKQEIAKLQAPESGKSYGKPQLSEADKQAKIERLTQESINIKVNYEENKAEALAIAKSVADNKVAVEQAAQTAIAQIQSDALKTYYSRATVLEQAHLQEKLANQKTELSSYMSMMAEKDEVTGESYASILANEELLSQQRQIWHDQLMLQAVEWGDYMKALYTEMAIQLQDGLAAGLTDCIIKGQSLSETFKSLASSLMTTLIKGVLQKWIANLGIIQALNKATSQQSIQNARQEASAEAAKTGAMAANATAAVIESNPWAAPGAGALVAGQLSMAKLFAASAFASGGAVKGTGTSTSDSIPAMLSNGEYVINARAAQELGQPTLNMLNQGVIPTFSDGGDINRSSSFDSSIATQAPVTFNVSAIDAESFMSWLGSKGGQAIKQYLYDNNREFTAETGVW